jgi:hypothetical protein
MLSKIKNEVYEHVLQAEKEKRQKQVAALPVTVLTKKNIANAALFVDRVDMLTLFGESSIGAEIGVDKGEFSRQIVDIVKPRKFHLIDCWDSERYSDSYNHVITNLKKEIQSGTVEINRGLSVDVLNSFPDEYFDWVYIDTSHSYEVTKAELELSHKKIRKGGIISGHDYVMGSWVGQVRYGVIEAVYEFCVNQDYEIIGLSTELPGHNASFALKKITA